MKQRSYTSEYRANAVKLAEKIGASAASRDLKISSNTLYACIKRAKSGDLALSTAPGEPKNAVNLAA